MKNIYITSFIGALLLVGAGCEAVPPAQKEPADTKVETTAATETAAESKKEDAQIKAELTGSAAAAGTVAAKPTPAPTPQPTTAKAGVTAKVSATTSKTVVETEFGAEGTVAESGDSDQEMIQLFEFKPTHPLNYGAYKLWDRYATRASLAAVRASPAGTEKYQETEWLPLDPQGTAMFNAGLAANLAMEKADKAFKAKQINTEQLVAAAVSSVSKYFQAILAFEATWGVKGE